MSQGGYAGTILFIDLSSGNITRVSTEIYTDKFLGGRGIASKIYWDNISPEIEAFDPENRLIFMTGPVSGIPGFASRFQVCGKSAVTNQFSYCNIGGSWGAYLKFAGYDGVVIHGKADKPVFLWIDDIKVELRDATHLKGKGAFFSEKKIREELGESVRVLTIGPAGENRVSFATFLASENSCGSGSLAGVMGAKNLKAIAIQGSNKLNIDSKEKISNLRARIRKLRANIPDQNQLMKWMYPSEGMKKSLCHACPNGCLRMSYKNPNGENRKFMCEGMIFYFARAERFYGKATDVPKKAAELCDDHGLDIRVIEAMIMWLSRCFKAGVLTDEQTDIPLSQIGSYEFIEALVRKIAAREGFGDLLADGTHKAAESLGRNAQEQLKDYIISTGEMNAYNPRLYITTGLLYAVEPRLPIHQLHEISYPITVWTLPYMGMKETLVSTKDIQAIGKRFWGSEIAADFSTYEGKAMAAVKIEDREYAKESLILCDLAWPIYFDNNSQNNVGDPSLESQICNAITGREVDEPGLYKIGERILNIQRAILAREGHKGREYDTIDESNFTIPLKRDFINPGCIVPGKNGEVLSRKGMVVDRNEFEKLKDEFYQIRGWDVTTGLQKSTTLEELNLSDVAQQLKEQGLAI